MVLFKQPSQRNLPRILIRYNIYQSTEITSGRQSSWGSLLRLHSWISGHSHTGSVVIAAGQPGGHVAGRQSVVLRELTLSQRVVAAIFLEELKKNKKTIVINRRRVAEKEPCGAGSEKHYAEIIFTFKATSHIIHHNCQKLRFCVNEQVKPNVRDCFTQRLKYGTQSESDWTLLGLMDTFQLFVEDRCPVTVVLRVPYVTYVWCGSFISGTHERGGPAGCSLAFSTSTVGSRVPLNYLLVLFCLFVVVHLKAALWNFSFCVDFGGPCGQRHLCFT